MPLAQMETASCCPGVRDNRYSVQLEIASNRLEITISNTFIMKTNLGMAFGWFLISKFVL
ncbi:hypothetical protein DOS84_00140 [Flavobacterium aquariorum]|uniref:Uncharacterized protein n=1 Tax=Flavobacterium aquariorum TaxID=2217670 RepID=A0A2W7TZX1_9FLAO|nr:hypothetical protein DOS84_00140 [Flavobacterium aquariorum]